MDSSQMKLRAARELQTLAALTAVRGGPRGWARSYACRQRALNYEFV
jgi:hypothetical protein